MSGRDFANDIFELGVEVEDVEALAVGASDLASAIKTEDQPTTARLVVLVLLLEKKAIETGNRARLLLREHGLCTCADHAPPPAPPAPKRKAVAK